MKSNNVHGIKGFIVQKCSSTRAALQVSRSWLPVYRQNGKREGTSKCRLLKSVFLLLKMVIGNSHGMRTKQAHLSLNSPRGCAGWYDMMAIRVRYYPMSARESRADLPKMALECTRGLQCQRDGLTGESPPSDYM